MFNDFVYDLPFDFLFLKSNTKGRKSPDKISHKKSSHLLSKRKIQTISGKQLLIRKISPVLFFIFKYQIPSELMGDNYFIENIYEFGRKMKLFPQKRTQFF